MSSAGAGTGVRSWRMTGTGNTFSNCSKGLRILAEIKKRLAYGVEPSKVEQLRDVIAIGSAAFGRRIRESVGQNEHELQHRRALRRRVPIEAVRRAIEKLQGAPWEQVAGRRGYWGRPLFLWAVRKHCGLTLREAGEAAGGMTVWAVDMAIRRLNARTATDPAIRDRQSKILNLLRDE